MDAEPQSSRDAEAGLAPFPDERALCERFAPPVRALALRHLRDRSLADDVVQEVLSAAILAIRHKRIATPAALPGYVLSACRKRVADLHRTEARRSALWAEFGGPEVALAGSVAEPDVPRVELEQVVAAMAPLSGRERQVLNEMYAQGRDTNEIARVLQTTPGHVRVLRHRAISKMRAALGFEEGP